jgi:hypothetical protein
MRVIKYITIVLVLCVSTKSSSQDFGLSFSYFLPKNGYFSTPISPFSIRGLGVNLNRYFALEAGASLYRMSGLNVKGLPFESKSPLIGPNFTILVPAELVLQLQAKGFQFDIKGGGFFFYGFGNRLNYGNFDRAFREHSGWDVANGDLDFKSNPGFGYHFGAELTMAVTNSVGVSLESNYMVGDAKFPLTGTFNGAMGSEIKSETIDYASAKMDFTGFEFSVGLIFSSGAPQKGRPASKKRRRR